MVSFIHKQDSMLQRNSINTMKSPEKIPEMQPTTMTSKRLLFQDDSFENAPEIHRPSELAQRRAAEKVIKDHDHTSNINIKQVQENLKYQNETLEHRKITRKRGYSIRPRSSSPHSPPKKGGEFSFLNIESGLKRTPERRSTEGESDKSGGLAKVAPNAIFDKEIEEISEKFILEKMTETGKINKHYKEQISEIKSIGGEAEIIDQIIQEMERNRANDIKELEMRIEKRRIEEVEMLKHR